MSKKAVFLTLPHIKYHAAFIAGLKDLKNAELIHYYMEKNLDVAQLTEPNGFKHYLKFLKEQAAGINLNPGRVPHTTYWLIHEDDADQAQWLGRVDIRHQLNDYLRRIGGHIGYVIAPSARKQGYGTKMLALALEKIRAGHPQLDSDQALLTCDETNLASKKIIETNGGVFAGYTEQAPPLPRKLRYWIPLLVE